MNEVQYKIEATITSNLVGDQARFILDKLVRDFAVEFRIKSAVLGGTAVQMTATVDHYTQSLTRPHVHEDLLASEPTQE